jgi:hypothetical protein
MKKTPSARLRLEAVVVSSDTWRLDDGQEKRLGDDNKHLWLRMCYLLLQFCHHGVKNDLSMAEGVDSKQSTMNIPILVLVVTPSISTHSRRNDILVGKLITRVSSSVVKPWCCIPKPFIVFSEYHSPNNVRMKVK